MRIAILGNSGSGKSTLARWLADQRGVPLLDLDTVAWEPGQIAVPRPVEAAASDVRQFCSSHSDWVVEGCYAHLVTVSLEFTPRLIFLNPGEEQCRANCLARPWEPHKYPSRQVQDEHLEYLLSWVSEYYHRSGDMSLAAHRVCYQDYAGDKEEITHTLQLDPPSPEVLGWLR